MVRSYYSNAQQTLDKFSANNIACAIINCAVGTPLKNLSAASVVPGSVTPICWRDLQSGALVFSAVDGQQWTFPRLLWDDSTVNANGKVVIGDSMQNLHRRR
jgi:hypothetical protein